MRWTLAEHFKRNLNPDLVHTASDWESDSATAQQLHPTRAATAETLCSNLGSCRLLVIRNQTPVEPYLCRTRCRSNSDLQAASAGQPLLRSLRLYIDSTLNCQQVGSLHSMPLCLYCFVPGFGSRVGMARSCGVTRSSRCTDSRQHGWFM